MDAHTTTTAPLTSRFFTADELAQHTNGSYTVEVADDGSTYTVSYTDADYALDAVDMAKAKSWGAYVRAGGNPRNKRSHSSQYAAVKKAILAAA